MRILLVYASTHGHTIRIAERIARSLRREGHHVDLRRAGYPPAADPAAYDAVVVGGSLYHGRHQSELVDWVAEHHLVLAPMPSAFFSVSLSAADHTPKADAATRACIDRFVEDTDWTPDRTATIAGCLNYRDYDPATRLLMQALMRRGGHPDDTSRNHELTDWEAVEAFARDFSQRLGRGRAAA